jgi:hypothetical protein
MNGQFLEEGISIKFFVKLEGNTSETCAGLAKAYGEVTMKNSKVFVWHRLFKEGSMSKSQIKTLTVTFFDIKGVVHYQFIPQGQTINQVYFVEILKRLLETVRRERPELWPTDWILHHNDAPAHKTLSAKQFLAQKSITEMKYPRCSSDLAPNDFLRFPKVNLGKKF